MYFELHLNVHVVYSDIISIFQFRNKPFFGTEGNIDRHHSIITAQRALPWSIFSPQVYYTLPFFYARFGHSQVNTHLWRLEEDGSISPNGHLALRDAYFAPERVSREGGIDPLFRGAVKQAAQEIDLEV